MSPFALLVEFVIKPDAESRFRELIFNNARMSLTNEPGCRQFDVLIAPDEPRRFVLYEIYDDAKAFDLHLASQHFKDFAAATNDMIASRLIRRLDLVGPEPYLWQR